MTTLTSLGINWKCFINNLDCCNLHFLSTRVVRSFAFPGVAPVRTETIEFLFKLCSIDEDGNVRCGPMGSGKENSPVASVNTYSDLIFGSPRFRNDKKARGITSVGQSAMVADTDGADENGISLRGLVAKLETGRENVARGPVRLKDPADEVNCLWY